MPVMPLGRGIAAICGLVFGILLCFLDPPKVMIALIGAPVLLSLMYRPLWGLLLFAVVATCIPYTTVSFGVRTTISEAILGLTWIGVLWQGFLGRYRHLLRWHPTETALLWLMLFSAIPFVYGQIAIQAEGSGAVNWVRWLLNLSILFLVPLLLRDERDRDRLIVALLVGTLIMLTVSILIFLKDRNATSMIPLLTKLKYAHPEAVEDIFSANYARMASPWVHPNLTGGVLALFIPLALFYGWTRAGWRRLLGLSVAILGCAGLMFSISRGAIVSLALVLILLTYKRVPYSSHILSIAVALGVALVLFYPPLQERMLTIFSSTNASTEVRMEEYQMFPEAMARYPLGIGFKVDPPVPGSGLQGISNLWLNFIYKTGIPGMLLFITVTLFWWREVRPQQKLVRITRDNALWIGSIAGLLAALLTGLFDHYFSFTMVLIALFWLLMSVSLQQARLFPLLRQAPEKKEENAKGMTVPAPFERDPDIMAIDLSKPDASISKFN